MTYRINYDKRSGRSGRSEESRCTWPKIVFAVSFLVIAGIMVWVFLPVDDLLDKVLPNFSDRGSDEETDQDVNATILTYAPIASDDNEEFQFMQCYYDVDNNNCCNGLDGSMCDLQVDEVMYASVHDAMATFEDGYLYGPKDGYKSGPNHRFQLEGALEHGFRALRLRLCNCNGLLQFCNGVCNLGSRDIIEVMRNINYFLDDVRSEVILITFQLDNKADQPIDLVQFYDLIDTISGLQEKIYIHDKAEPWPTLRQVVDDNTRLLLFHYNGPACRVSNSTTRSCPDGLHYWFDYAVETESQFYSISDVRMIPKSCNITRGSGTFLAVNSFVTPPSQSAAETINSLRFAENRIQACSDYNDGKKVNIIQADYWLTGDLPQVVQEHNAKLATKAGTSPGGRRRTMSTTRKTIRGN